MEYFLHYLTLPYLLSGIDFTLIVTGLGLAGGLMVGLALAGMQLSRFWPLAAVARAYTIVFRGTPLILQLVFAYDALPHIGIKLSAISAAGLALALNEAPFIAEIIRAGVIGVDRGQILAGQSLGMTPAVLMHRVIAPQAIRVMVPALGNETISALKNSSLASVISVEELTLRSTQLASSTFDFFSIFLASGLMYLVLTGIVAAIQIAVEYYLDLDRGSMQERLARLLPWWRADAGLAASREKAEASPLRSVAESGAISVARASDPPQRPALTVTRSCSVVEVRALRKGYSGQVVLDGIDLIVQRAEVVAVLGPSGSGKSTLLRCINHLEDWESGTIHVGGRRLGFRDDGRRLWPRELAMERAQVGVGMVFQQFNLFGHLSAKENIAGPLRWVHHVSREDADRRAHELLDRIGLSERADALPRHLSGGQQQRVAIARAIASNPSVLLLDEPTSALDPELVSEVLEVIQRLAAEDGLTMLISTHHLQFAEKVADRVVFLSGGAIVEEGPAHEVLTRPKHALTARFLQRMGADAASETAPEAAPPPTGQQRTGSRAS
jgi:polar amino acid transport system permease protein